NLIGGGALSSEPSSGIGRGNEKRKRSNPNEVTMIDLVDSPDLAQRPSDSTSISRTRSQYLACSSDMSSRPWASTLNQRQDSQTRRSLTIFPAQSAAIASAMTASRITPQIACFASGSIAATSSSV